MRRAAAGAPSSSKKGASIDELAERYGWGAKSAERKLLEAADKADGKITGTTSAQEVLDYLEDPKDGLFFTSQRIVEFREQTEEKRSVSSYAEDWARKFAQFAAPGRNRTVTPGDVEQFTKKLIESSFESVPTPTRTSPVWIPNQKVTALTGAVAAVTGEKHLLNPGGVPADLPPLFKGFMRIQPDKDARVSSWVAHELSYYDLLLTDVTLGLAPKIARSDVFTKDPDHPNTGTSADYRNSGLASGHLKPAKDASTLEAMLQSFFHTNIVPQDPGLNSKAWMLLELATRQLVFSSQGTASVFTGGLYLDSKGRPTTPKKTIGKNEVEVPTHLWKAVLLVRPDGKKQTYAYLIPNTNPGPQRRRDMALFLHDHRVSVDDLEELTGLDLFSKLDGRVEKRIEAIAEPKIDFPIMPGKKDTGAAEYVFGDRAKPEAG